MELKFNQDNYDTAKVYNLYDSYKIKADNLDYQRHMHMVVKNKEFNNCELLINVKGFKEKTGHNSILFQNCSFDNVEVKLINSEKGEHIDVVFQNCKMGTTKFLYGTKTISLKIDSCACDFIDFQKLSLNRLTIEFSSLGDIVMTGLDVTNVRMTELNSLGINIYNSSIEELEIIDIRTTTLSISENKFKKVYLNGATSRYTYMRKLSIKLCLGIKNIYTRVLEMELNSVVPLGIDKSVINQIRLDENMLGRYQIEGKGIEITDSVIIKGADSFYKVLGEIIGTTVAYVGYLNHIFIGDYRYSLEEGMVELSKYITVAEQEYISIINKLNNLLSV